MSTLIAFVVGVAVVFGGAMLVQFLQGAAARKQRRLEAGEEQPAPVVPLEDLTDEIHSLLEQGQNIAALKLVRTHTGWGLKASKAYVEDLQREAAGQAGAAIAAPSKPTLFAPKDWQPQMIELLEQGKKIPAIKLTREKTGLDLKGAKAYVEDQQRRLQEQKKADALRPNPRPELSQDWQAAILELLEQDQKILAIKLTREKTGLGLKEAKEYVDEQQRCLEKQKAVDALGQQKAADVQAMAVASLVDPKITSHLGLTDYMEDCFRQDQKLLAIQEMIKFTGVSQTSATIQVNVWWKKWTEEGLAPNYQPRLYNQPGYAAEGKGYDQEEALRDALRELLAKGQKIEAIKQTRRHFGMPLKEAKEYVEAIPSET